MNKFKSLSDQIFSLRKDDFETVSLDVFRFQALENGVYRDYLKYLEVQTASINSLDKIPFLPIEFFKTHSVKSGDWKTGGQFESSGTTGMDVSKHTFPYINIYLRNCDRIFNEFYGKPEDFVWLALLPSYLERTGSGLVAMADFFIEKSKFKQSGFYLDDHAALIATLKKLKVSGKKAILLGVTFALLDLAEKIDFTFEELLIMETGGMKGRREEMVRQDVHSLLKRAFGVESIHSEYGMTELFSQAYSSGEGIFYPGSTMRVMSRDINDPRSVLRDQRNGALNVIDLANLHSCSFIETKDLGKVYEDGSFEVLGRMDNSDVRGCNLMIT